MVDISAKGETKRFARAQSCISMGPGAFSALMENRSPKGDVFETAKIAGIMAAKNTPNIIPMCHPLNLTQVNIQIEPNKDQHAVTVISEVRCLGRTGVEMEALTAASAAVLTIYDMMKWCDKGMIISETKLLHKSGGKSGDYDA
jgi:cyclic pyranopterin phosphate synthase